MKLKLLLTTAILGTALAVPASSSAQATTQDSVVLTNGPAEVPAPPNVFEVYAINATSGPSGENPTGQVRFDALLGGPAPAQYHVGGPVTCLAVSGKTATINFQDQMDLAGTIITLRVVDGAPDSFFAQPIGRAPTDCTPPPTLTGGQLSFGDITVVDMQPLPIGKEQCKDGAWRNFPQFKNQGQCIAFLNQGP